MKLLNLLIGAAIFSNAAFGSLLIQCEFTGDLKTQNIYSLGESSRKNLEKVATYKITSAADAGSHFSRECDRRVGSTVVFNTKSPIINFEKDVQVSYRFMSFYGRNGIESSTTYKIIDEKASQDASEPREFLGFLNGMPRILENGQLEYPKLPDAVSLNFKATIKSNGCTDASHFETKLIERKDGYQELSIKRIKTDTCKRLSFEKEIGFNVVNFNRSQKELLYDGELLPVKVVIGR